MVRCVPAWGWMRLMVDRRAHMDEPPADEAPCGRIACGAHARRSVSPPTKDEPADEEQRERTWLWLGLGLGLG